jgi:hypothetical protein
MKSPEFRLFPYPFKAMLAICSDLDETPDSDRYFAISRFLNSRTHTAAGRGVGLEVGNTIYFDMPDEQFAYWNADDTARELVRSLIKSGHIDCFHSFGDLATKREHAKRALTELERHGCRIECWVDHAAAPSNFGSDIMKGVGDVPGSETYHADLTYNHGVRYVWRGRVTSVIGQNQKRSYRGLFNIRHPVGSVRTLMTETAKGVLAHRNNPKYAMHAGNKIQRPADLRNDKPVFEFMRCNPYWGGVGGGATADGFAEVLTGTFLKRLVDRRAVSILYTHLGKSRFPDTLFSDKTVEAFRHLASFADRGDILVATTRRLLGYSTMIGGATVAAVPDATGETISVDTSTVVTLGLPCDLSGLTIYVQESGSATLLVDGMEVRDIERNPADEYGRQSITIPWRRLDFPLS